MNIMLSGSILWLHMNKTKKNCNSQLRVCPKIAANHISLNNSCLKMRVRLATQVRKLTSQFFFKVII